MDNVTFIQSNNPDGTITEYAVIDYGKGEFTSMTKAHYEELKASEAKVI